jgi:hypothetical protein
MESNEGYEEVNCSPILPLAMLFEPVDLKLKEHHSIIRYMRISAFLMFLKGKVFIPSLETLQQGDPWESQLPIKIDKNLHVGFSEFKDRDCEHWLQSRAQD